MSGVSNAYKERAISIMRKTLCEEGGDCIGCYDCECPIHEYCEKLYKAGYRLCPKKEQTIEEKTEIKEIFDDVYKVMDALISSADLCLTGTDIRVEPRRTRDFMVCKSALGEAKHLIESVEKKYIKE